MDSVDPGTPAGEPSTRAAPFERTVPPPVDGTARTIAPTGAPVDVAALCRPGRRIGRYEVLRELGRGGMGIVLAVREPGLERTLALKLILGQASPAALARFGREAQVMARVRHRSVVGVHELGRAPEGPFIASELVEGEALRSRLQLGPLDPRAAALIGRDLADGLAACHAAGVIHRDVKPHNVILRPDSTPVLLDFGIARDETAERLTRTGEMMGSPNYMAPEQADGTPPGEVDGRADVYGLGATLFHCLTGQAPFAEASSAANVVTHVLLKEPRWPATPAVPPALKAIVQAAMAKDRGARHPSAAALREDLDLFLRGERPWALGRAPRRGPLVAGSIAALLVAGGLGAAMFIRTRPGDVPPATKTPAAVTERPRPDPAAAAAARAALERIRGQADATERGRALQLWLTAHPTHEAAGAARADLAAALDQAPVLRVTCRHTLPEGMTGRTRVRFLSGRRIVAVREDGRSLVASIDRPPEAGVAWATTLTGGWATSLLVGRDDAVFFTVMSLPHEHPEAASALVRFDPATLRITGDLALPTTARSAAIDRAGRRIAVTGGRTDLSPSTERFLGGRLAIVDVSGPSPTAENSGAFIEQGNDVAFSPDGSLVAVGIGGAYISEIGGAEAKERCVRVFRAADLTVVGQADDRTFSAVTALAWADDRTLLFGGHTQALRRVRLEAPPQGLTPGPITDLLAQDESVRFVTGERTAHRLGLVAIVADPATGRAVSLGRGPLDGRKDTSDLRGWDAASGAEVAVAAGLTHRPTDRRGAICDLDLSPDGRWLAVGRMDGSAEVWALDPKAAAR